MPSNLSKVVYVSRVTSADGQVEVHATVLGMYGMVVPDAMVEVYLDFVSESEMLGVAKTDAQGHLRYVVRTRQPPGRNNVRMHLPDFTGIPPVNLSMVVRACVVGEVAPFPETCEPCIPGFYSLDARQTMCNVCPAGAECPGGASMVPLLGWWHSTPTSSQMHR
jgi:hypothetical protein